MIIFNTGVEIPLDPKGFAFIQINDSFPDDEICIQTYQIRSLFSRKATKSLPHTI
ncbi:hypothetical protein YC2023_099750 [Brassica napus]